MKLEISKGIEGLVKLGDLVNGDCFMHDGHFYTVFRVGCFGLKFDYDAGDFVPVLNLKSNTMRLLHKRQYAKPVKVTVSIQD